MSRSIWAATPKVLVGLGMLLVLASCGKASTASPDLAATEASIRAGVLATVTAEAPPPTATARPSATPAPTIVPDPSPTPAGTPSPAKAFHWERYDYDIEILPNGDMLFNVLMHFSFDSGSFSQGYYSFDMNRLTDVLDVQVLEGDQAYTQVESDQVGGYQVTLGDEFEVLWWFPPSSGVERTFTLRYRVIGGLRIYPGGDQLYWNFYAGQRSGYITAGTVTARLPAEVPMQSLLVAVDPPDIPLFQPDPKTIQARITGLRGNQAVVLRVQFPHGLVDAEPAAWQVREESE